MQNYNDSAKSIPPSQQIVRKYWDDESDGDWDDILSPDDLEEYYERRQYEKQMRRGYYDFAIFSELYYEMFGGEEDPLNCLYSVSTSIPQPMQVTNSATIVDYFPEAFIAEADEIKGMKVVVKRFIRRVYFRATGQKSYSTVLGIEAKYDWQSRIAKGAEVTDFNTDKMDRSEYMPMMC